MADLPAECPHSYALTPDTCGICLGHPPIDQPTPRETHPTEIGSVFAAKLEGTCPECMAWIEPGDKIQGWSDGRYRHEECTP